jgi:hypothetical protein
MKGRRIRRGREPPSPALEDGSLHREWYVVCFVNSEYDTKQSSGDLMAHTPFASASSGFRTSRRVNNVRNIERWASVATASAVIAYGVSRRNKQGMWLAAAAAPLAYRGVVGEWPRLRNGRARDDTRASLSGAGGTCARVDSARKAAARSTVSGAASRTPQFMSHLEQVVARQGALALRPAAAGTTVQVTPRSSTKSRTRPSPGVRCRARTSSPPARHVQTGARQSQQQQLCIWATAGRTRRRPGSRRWTRTVADHPPGSAPSQTVDGDWRDRTRLFEPNQKGASHA